MHLLLAIATFVGAASVCFNHVMTKVQKMTFCQKLKIWYILSHRWSKNDICRLCQWCTTPPSTSRLTRFSSVCLASLPKVIIVVVYCLKYVVAETPLLQPPISPKVPWDQSDRVTLLPTRRPPLTRHMALHPWVATFFISDIIWHHRTEYVDLWVDILLRQFMDVSCHSIELKQLQQLCHGKRN